MNNMIDHIILIVTNVEQLVGVVRSGAGAARQQVLHGIQREERTSRSGIVDGNRAFFWLKHGAPDPQNIHWGFRADNNTGVDAFYKAAIAAGARDNISPRARLEYYPGYYAADVFDPDGYSFEIVHKS
jgi:catechol 2,3-dioxygenase-like lactoylglutathione lyase family enzyme